MCKHSTVKLLHWFYDFKVVQCLCCPQRLTYKDGLYGAISYLDPKLYWDDTQL
jgi:hypothetical protein